MQKERIPSECARRERAKEIVKRGPLGSGEHGLMGALAPGRCEHRDALDALLGENERCGDFLFMSLGGWTDLPDIDRGG